MITTPTVRVFYEEGEKLVGGDVIKCSTLAAMLNMRAGTVIMPQVTIAPKPSNGQHE